MFWLYFYGAFIVLIILGIIFDLCTKKYLNPYKLIMIFGKKGSGKTTLLTKIAMQAMRKGKKVYSTVYIPNTVKIDPKDIGIIHMDPGSVLLVDEVGMIWDNRQFKDFKPHCRDWFKLQRHYKIRVYLFSQSFDIDKKLRDLTDQMFLVSNLLRVYSYAKRIRRVITLTEAESDKESKIADNLKFESVLFFFLGTRKLTYIPKYIKYFDSYDAPALKIIPEEQYKSTPAMDKYLKRVSILKRLLA